jgi:hypothetical protein
MNFMTKREFLAALSKTAGQWSVDNAGRLMDFQGRCPIVAVAEGVYGCVADGPTWHGSSAVALGLDVLTAEEIVFAADHAEPRLPLRDRLLAVCRTVEPEIAAAPRYSEWWWTQPMSARARWETTDEDECQAGEPEAGELTRELVEA